MATDSLSASQKIIGLKAAVQTASKCPPYENANTTAASDERYYGFNKDGTPVEKGQPETDEAALWEGSPGGKKPEGATSIKVPAGILVVRGRPRTRQTAIRASRSTSGS